MHFMALAFSYIQVFFYSTLVVLTSNAVSFRKKDDVGVRRKFKPFLLIEFFNIGFEDCII